MCKLKKFIYGLKQASRSWNTRFDQVIKSYGFDQCIDESCVYKKRSENVVVFLVLYVDDILLIGNDVGVLFVEGMVIHTIRYEGLGRSRSHPWDQVFVRS